MVMVARELQLHANTSCESNPSASLDHRKPVGNITPSLPPLPTWESLLLAWWGQSWIRAMRRCCSIEDVVWLSCEGVGSSSAISATSSQAAVAKGEETRRVPRRRSTR